MSNLYHRVVVDGVEVRATRDPPPPQATGWPVKSAYPVQVEGVTRAVLAYLQPGYGRRDGHKGWALLSLQAHHTSPHYLAREAKTWAGAKAAADELLGKVPALMALGRLPTAPEAAAIMERERLAAVAAQAQREIDDAARKARREQDRIAYEQATAAMLAGLAELRDRAEATPDLLTNFERDALLTALRRLSR